MKILKEGTIPATELAEQHASGELDKSRYHLCVTKEGEIGVYDVFGLAGGTPIKDAATRECTGPAIQASIVNRLKV